MSGFLGMAPVDVREHARLLDDGAEAAREIEEVLGRSVAAVSWVGPDAEAFRAAWSAFHGDRLRPAAERLDDLARLLRAEADEQDVTSAEEGTSARDGSHPGTGTAPAPAPAADPTPARRPSTLPAGPPSTGTGGYLSTNAWWLPDVIEDPLESRTSDVGHTVSVGIGLGFDQGMDTVIEAGEDLGIRTEGLEQFRRDSEHVGGLWSGVLTGENVPTYAELLSGGLVAAGSGVTAVGEAGTGKDWHLFDDRPGGIVESVESSTEPARSPQTLQDLVVDNDALRAGGSLEAGQIGIQEVQSSEGGEPVYIVQVPPTEGAPVTSIPEAYGGQGNSRDWASNLRLVSGQHTASMDDVEAAMSTPGPDGRPLVPPGSQVMFVGHSQGGIIAAHLAADASFNNTSGEAGTYDVTHSLSVGSPVQTVVPAQASTEVVNVTHGPVRPGWSEMEGDPIAHGDLQGARPFAAPLQSPDVHEVVLPGESARIGMPWLEANHDSVGRDHDPDAGYAGTLGRSTATDPTLSALQEDTTGVYLGPGTVVTSSSVVTVGRGELG